MEYNYQQINYPLPDVGINPNMIVKIPDLLYIPNDPENSDWQQYQVWLSEGNQPLPPAGA